MVIRFAARLLVCHVQYHICIFEVCCEGVNGFAAAPSADRFSVCALRALLDHSREGILIVRYQLYQAFRFPGYCRSNQHGRKPELYAEFCFDSFLFRLENFTAVDQHIVAIFRPVHHDLSWNDASQCILRLPSWRFASPPFNWTLQISEIALRP